MTEENSNTSENPEKENKKKKKKTKKENQSKNKDSYIPEDTNDLDNLDYIEDNYDRNC